MQAAIWCCESSTLLSRTSDSYENKARPQPNSFLHSIPKSPSPHIPNSNSDVDFHTCIAVQEMNFKTAMGRAVYNIVFHPPKSAAAETFQPRRTAFLFDMDDIGYGLGIPTTLRRSKGDCPKVCPLVEFLGHNCRVDRGSVVRPWARSSAVWGTLANLCSCVASGLNRT